MELQENLLPLGTSRLVPGMAVGMNLHQGDRTLKWSKAYDRREGKMSSNSKISNSNSSKA